MFYVELFTRSIQAAEAGGYMNLQDPTALAASGAFPAAAHRWSARMITPTTDGGEGTHAPLVAARFDLPGVPRAAQLRISALGLYCAFINGQRVGADVLTPGWTNYDDRLAYQTYDVAPLLAQGSNRIDIWLADGWYRSPLLWADWTVRETWGTRLAAIAEIESEGEILLATGPDWTSGLSPITRSGIYYGEDYDARLEGQPANNPVEVLTTDLPRLVSQEAEPVRALGPLPAIESWTDAQGRQLFDFGQNCSGVVRITIAGEAGATVRIEHSEVLGPDRAFENANYRGARSEARYTLRGEGEETYKPTFSFMGYRYARVTITGAADLLDIVSIPISSVPEAAAGFTCGEPLVDKLVLNTIWSQRSNFIEVPTDCPQRDERLGWTGDAQVFAGAACWLADCERFFSKFLRDVIVDQRPDGAIANFSPDPTRLKPGTTPREMAGSTGWGDAITVIPWQLYLHYGDKAVLREAFPAMLRWLDFLWSHSNGPILSPKTRWGSKGFTFGDWLQPTGSAVKPRETIGDDCAATLYHFLSTDLAARIAAILGEDTEAERLSARREEIRAAFTREFFTPTGRLAYNDQTSYALAFQFGLVPPEHFEAARDYFRQSVARDFFLIGTGFIGTPALLPALTRLGLIEEAQKLFLNRKTPGWLYQVEQGATTIWERWDAIAPDRSIHIPEMNSFNHYAYGAVCQWLFEDVAGVKPTIEGPGFDTVSIDPTILPALGHVSMWHQCRHGRIEAGWSLDGNLVTYSLVLPQGCAGRLEHNRLRANVALDGRAVTVPGEGLPLAPGAHAISFETKIPNP